MDLQCIIWRGFLKHACRACDHSHVWWSLVGSDQGVNQFQITKIFVYLITDTFCLVFYMPEFHFSPIKIVLIHKLPKVGWGLGMRMGWWVGGSIKWDKAYLSQPAKLEMGLGLSLAITFFSHCRWLMLNELCHFSPEQPCVGWFVGSVRSFFLLSFIILFLKESTLQYNTLTILKCM